MLYQYSLNLTPSVALQENIVLLEDNRFPFVLEQWRQANTFGFDIETFSNVSNSDGALHPETGEIRTFQIALQPPQGGFLALVVDLGWSQKERSRRFQKLRSLGFWNTLAERLANPDVEAIGHSLNFEQKWLLSKFGYSIRSVVDTKLLSQVYWAGLDPWLDKMDNYPHSLESVCWRLGIAIDKTRQSSDWGWGELGEGRLSHAQLNYAARDAIAVLEVSQKFGELLPAVAADDHAKIECAAAPAFAQMSHSGMPVDLEKLELVKQQYLEVYERLTEQLATTLPEAINCLDSPKMLKSLLNQKFKLNLKNTDARNLSAYWHIPELKLISLLRTQGCYLDYLNNLQASVKEGYVRGRYQQIAPKGFGRATCSHPNLHNPPHPDKMPFELQKFGLPPVRSVFVAPPEKVLVVGDLMKAHSAIAGEASGDPEMSKRFRSDSGDIFCAIAYRLAQLQNLGSQWTEENIRLWAKDKSHPNHAQASLLRAISKNAHYGSQNGQGYKRFAETVRTGSGILLTDAEAKAGIESWRQTYRGLYQFQQQIVQRANTFKPAVLGLAQIEAKTKFGLGCVKSLCGRYVFLPKYPCKERGASVRFPDACAAYWTVTEGTIIKLALARCLSQFDANPDWKAWIGNSCHDEIDAVGEAIHARSIALAVQNSLVEAMGLFIRTLPVHEGEPPERLICRSWADKH